MGSQSRREVELLAAAVLSGLIGDLADTVVILIIVLLNAAIGFWQEWRADQALQALRRMGRDPATSILNGNSQAHDVSNLFVTDGAAMTSSACQNPSLTYMAFTARAADYAVAQLKRREL